MSARVAHPLVLRLLAIVTLATLGFVAPKACESDGRPTGYHSINVAWGQGELGLVWLNNTMGREEVVFARAAEDAKLKGNPAVLSDRAQGSAPPLVAFGGGNYVVVWTHHGSDEPGMYLGLVLSDGSTGEFRLIDKPVTPCRQLVWIGDSFAIGWHDGERLYLALLDPSGALTTQPRVLDAGQVKSCRLAWGDGALKLAFTLEGEGLVVASVPIEDEPIARILAPDASAVAIAAGGSDALVGYTEPAHPGAHVVRLSARLEEQGRVSLDRGDAHIRELAVAASTRLFVLWSEFKDASAKQGSVYFAAAEANGELSEPQLIGPKRKARPVVNAASSGNRVAVSWSDRRNDGTVGWGIFTFGSGTSFNETTLSAN